MFKRRFWRFRVCLGAQYGGIVHSIELHLLYNPDGTEFPAFLRISKYLISFKKYCFHKFFEGVDSLKIQPKLRD
jgi:hypothetical protein